MLRYIISLVMVLIALPSFAQYEIKINLKNYDHDTIMIGYNMGEKILSRDTLVSDGESGYVLKGDEDMEPGVYMILIQPDNSFVQFFVNENDQEFSVDWDIKNPADVVYNGSVDNQVFNDYIRYLSKKREELEKLTAERDTLSAQGKDVTELIHKMEVLDQDVKKEQGRIINAYPNTITTLFLKSSINTVIPTYTGTEEEIKQKEFEYYKAHYFDNIDLGNPATIRTPYIHKRVMNYIDRLTPKIPDSINNSIDYLLKEMEPSKDTYRYYLSHFVNTYANKPIIGMDAVYVHIVDNYYAKGKATWTSEENLAEIFKTANNIRVSLIGNIFPDITTYLSDDSPVRMLEIESPYKVVVFWSHVCPHCKKTMPTLTDFQKEFQDQGVKVVTVCTKGRDKTQACKDYAAEHNMESMMNTFDASQKYRESIYVNSTPKVYVLDKNNKILIKDLGIDKLAEVMPEIIKENTPLQLK